MVEGLGGVTTEAVRLALDAAVLRHQVIANNVANAQTPGFAPLRVTFEEHFAAAGEALWGADGEEALRSLLATVEEQLGAPGSVSPAEGEVEIDEEMVQLADNTIRYQALLEGIAKKMSVIRIAIEEGRR